MAVHHSGKGAVQAQGNAVIMELLVEILHHVVVKGGHDLAQSFHDGDVFPGLLQILSALHADEAAAYHHHVLYTRVQTGFDAHHVLDVADGEHVVTVDALDGAGHDGRRAGGQHQLVVALGEGFSCLGVAHGDSLGGAVNGNDLPVYLHVDVVPSLEGTGRHHHQVVGRGHHAAQIIGQRAVGVGHVPSPLEHADLRRLVQSAHPGRHRGAAGHTAHYYQLHG